MPDPQQQASPARKAWLPCAVLGACLAVLALYLVTVFPPDGGDYARGYGAPVFAFEMARSVDDLWKVFGPVDDPRHAARLAAMDLGNRWDYLFMLLYAGFIGSFFVGAHLERPDWRWRLGAVLGVVAALADAVENVVLFGLTSDVAAAPNLELLVYPVWTKFVALISAVALAGLYLRGESSVRWRRSGAVVLACAAACSLTLYAPSRFGWVIGTTLGVCWVSQLVLAVGRLRAA